jgi:hypothetical protein
VSEKAKRDFYVKFVDNIHGEEIHHGKRLRNGTPRYADMIEQQY